MRATLGAACVAATLMYGAPFAAAAPSPDAVDAIDARYAGFGGPASLLGYPVDESVDAPGGAMREYEGGAIYYSKPTGAHVVYGAILERYRALGGPGGQLGYPLNDESDTGDGVGRFNNFSAPTGAAVYWTPDSGPAVVTGQVLQAWRGSGGVAGPFGYPAADTAVADGVQTGAFAGPEGTRIQWSAADGPATVPAELAATIPGFTAGEGTPMPTTTALPSTTPTSGAVPSTSDRTTAGSTRWWIPVAITAVLALGLLAVLFRRRRAEPESIVQDAPAEPPVNLAAQDPRWPVRPEIVDEVVAPAPIRPPTPRPAVPPTRATPPPAHQGPPAPPPPRVTPPAPIRIPPPPPPQVTPPPPPAPVRTAPLTAVPTPRADAPAPRPTGRHVAEPRRQAPKPPTPPLQAAPVEPPPRSATGLSVKDSASIADAAPVITYDTPAPIESAVRVTYANNAVGDDQASLTDKSDRPQD